MDTSYRDSTERALQCRPLSGQTRPAVSCLLECGRDEDHVCPQKRSAETLARVHPGHHAQATMPGPPRPGHQARALFWVPGNNGGTAFFRSVLSPFGVFSVCNRRPSEARSRESFVTTVVCAHPPLLGAGPCLAGGVSPLPAADLKAVSFWPPWGKHPERDLRIDPTT